MAVSSCNARESWLAILKSITCQAFDVWHHSHSSVRWMMMRNIYVTQILFDIHRRDGICDLTFEFIGINGSRISFGVVDMGVTQVPSVDQSLLLSWHH
jgi:hypothetical protein